MKKLTPEQIERIIDENFGFANVKEAMLFMQDEVLRINGDLLTGRAQVEAEQRARMQERYKDRASSPATADFDLPVAYSDDTTPRATGCPDTMDDMGHFAEVDMPAFLRKQAG